MLDYGIVDKESIEAMGKEDLKEIDNILKNDIVDFKLVKNLNILFNYYRSGGEGWSAYNCFCYGFILGKRAERRRRKK